jgi:hypothetical protein
MHDAYRFHCCFYGHVGVLPGKTAGRESMQRCLQAMDDVTLFNIHARAAGNEQLGDDRGFAADVGGAGYGLAACDAARGI